MKLTQKITAVAIALPIVVPSMSPPILDVRAMHAARSTVDTIGAGLRRFDRSPRIGVDTLDGFSVLGDSSRLTYTMTRAISKNADGSLVLETRIGPVSYRSTLRLDPLVSVDYRTASRRDSAAVTFERDRVVGWVVPAPDKPREEIEHEFSEDVMPFADGMREILAQVLPLSDGYAAAFRSFDPYHNKGEWWSLRVVGSETLSYRGRRVDCWIIETTIPSAEPPPTHRQWIAKDSRVVVQDRNMRLSPDGRTLIARAR